MIIWIHPHSKYKKNATHFWWVSLSSSDYTMRKTTSNDSFIYINKSKISTFIKNFT